MKSRSAADVDGPWIDTPGPETGLVLRCKKHWSVPSDELSNAILATFLRQRIALAITIPEAQRRLDAGIVDGTELYDDELTAAFNGVTAKK